MRVMNCNGFDGKGCTRKWAPWSSPHVLFFGLLFGRFLFANGAFFAIEEALNPFLMFFIGSLIRQCIPVMGPPRGLRSGPFSVFFLGNLYS